MEFHSKFDLFDKASVDGSDIVGTVAGVAYYPGDRVMVALSWFAAGTHHEVWFDEDRLIRRAQ